MVKIPYDYLFVEYIKRENLENHFLENRTTLLFLFKNYFTTIKWYLGSHIKLVPCKAHIKVLIFSINKGLFFSRFQQTIKLVKYWKKCEGK
jgi:hypothetical protein